MKGKIFSYRADKGYGFISSGDEPNRFFHISNVGHELNVLLGCRKWRDMPITFDLEQADDSSKPLAAINVNLDLSEKCVGYVKVQSEDEEHDKYFAVDFQTGDTLPFHHSGILKKDDRFVNIEDDAPIVFSVNQDSYKHNIATDVLLIDTRSFIQRYVYFNDYLGSIKILAERFCFDEDWDYVENKTGGYPVLISYLNQTFKRILEQGKLVQGKSKSGKIYAYFNTGLVNSYQEDIYVYLERNPDYNECQPWGIKICPWLFLEFQTEASYYRQYFRRDAEMATYFEEAEVRKLIFDTTIKISMPDWDHLENRRHRVDSEEIREMSSIDFRDAIKDSLDIVKNRIRRNYKTAIPYYYNGDIQFLIPLCARKDRSRALAAMAVQKQEEIYQVKTILTLDQAYNNARLLAKPDREWLNP